MDSYEATRVVFSRIQKIDPENASKIMGVLLIQDHGEKEMIRLAFGPEALLHALILKARKDLASPPSSPFASSNPIAIARQTSRLSLSLTIPTNPSDSLEDQSLVASNLSSSSSSSLSSASQPFYGHNSSSAAAAAMDEFQLQEQGFPSPYWPSSPSVHRRSCSVSDMCLSAAEDQSSGFGWKPCLYFARGFCKNGSSCRFLHGDESVQLDNVNNVMVNDQQVQHHELLRSKSAQQQRLVSGSSSPSSNQLMANSFPYSPKCMSFLLQQNETQRAAAAALMMGSEDLHKFGRTRLERSEFAMNGGVNPASRQIYLTFPADSTFREEDVSNYFSIYGPVQDVRIPYQQKRMFGFVTFVYSETVKLILAKGNPHFVCDARVLVKPYKEKGKVHDKKQQQCQVDREFSSCGTPTGLDSRDPFDLQLGARMFYGSQDMLLRRKLEEQAELQQAIELQSRRLMNLQLLDVKKHHQRALSTGSPVHSPIQSPNFFSQNLVLPSIQSCSEVVLDQNFSTPKPNLPPGDSPVKEEENGDDKECPHDEIDDLLESLEHNLPDSPFASPTKARGGDYNHMHAFSGYNHVAAVSEANNLSPSATSSLLPSSPSLDMASFTSFNCQLPRFSSGHSAMSMYASTAGGPKCPVGI